MTEEREAYDLGAEAAARGIPLLENPFLSWPTGSIALFKAWRRGHKSKSASPMRHLLPRPIHTPAIRRHL
jgi:hypothetical protein